MQMQWRRPTESTDEWTDLTWQLARLLERDWEICSQGFDKNSIYKKLTVIIGSVTSISEARHSNRNIIHVPNKKQSQIPTQMTPEKTCFPYSRNTGGPIAYNCCFGIISILGSA